MASTGYEAYRSTLTQLSDTLQWDTRQDELFVALVDTLFLQLTDGFMHQSEEYTLQQTFAITAQCLGLSRETSLLGT